MCASSMKLGVLVSGSGTTLQNFIEKIAAGELDARVELVIASRGDILALQRADNARLSSQIVDRRKFADTASFSREVFSLCDKAAVDLVCLAGWRAREGADWGEGDAKPRSGCGAYSRSFWGRSIRRRG